MTGQDAIVVADDDQVRRHLNLAKTACKSKVVHAIREKAPEPSRIDVVLLERNLETVISTIDPSWQGKGKPTPEERDNVLCRAGWDGQEAREQLLREVPSFKRLVLAAIRRLEGDS